MKIKFPSAEFDDAVAAVCHDSASEDQVRALNELLRSNAAARDEYILRLELHSRLASDPDLLASEEPDHSTVAEAAGITLRPNFSSSTPQRRNRKTPLVGSSGIIVGRD